MPEHSLHVCLLCKEAIAICSGLITPRLYIQSETQASNICWLLPQLYIESRASAVLLSNLHAFGEGLGATTHSMRALQDGRSSWSTNSGSCDKGRFGNLGIAG